MRRWTIDPPAAVMLAEEDDGGFPTGETTTEPDELKNIVGLFGGYTTD